MNIREVFIAGLWGASAVTVAGYTWESAAAAGGWQSFPGIGSGGNTTIGSGGNVTPTASRLAKAQARKDQSTIGGRLSGFLSNPLQSFLNVFGKGQIPLTPAEQAQVTRLGDLPSPPTKIVKNLRAARTAFQNNPLDNKTRVGALRAYNSLVTWGTQNGWTRQDATTFAQYGI